MDAEIVIAGGGLVGLTLGVALGRAGVAATVVDRAPAAAQTAAGFDGRVSAIAAGSQRVLAAVDLWRRLAAEAEPIRAIRVSDGASLLHLHYDGAADGTGPMGWIVENRAIRRALQAAAAETPLLRVLDGRTITGFERAADTIAARLDDGTRLRARLLVAADGKDSPLRAAAGIAALTARYAQTGIVCTVAHARPHRGIAQERFLPAGPFAILPMTGDRSSLVWTERADLAPALLALDAESFAAELARRFGDHLGLLRVVGPRFAYPLTLVLADRYVAPRLALAGDAAHAIHPIAGQGLNLGLRDTAVLAETVVDAMRLGLDPGTTVVLDGYEVRRRFDNTLMLAVTDTLNRLFSNDLGPIRLARDLGLAAVDAVPPLKRTFMRHAMGTVGALPRLMRGEAL